MAEKFKSIAKSGWHPERDRASSSGGQSEGRLGQVKGMLGRGGGEKSNLDAARNHQSTPLSSLKDPSSFAPPPRRLDYGANPTASAHAQTASSSTSSTANAAAKPKPPSLPPRLPPRQNSNPNEHAPAPPPTYNEATQGSASQGMLNQGAINRLGQAGISVPGFGVGRTASPPVPPRQVHPPPAPVSAPAPAPATAGHASQLGELQGRFASMSTKTPTSEAPTTGTTWAEKQAALRTASGLRDDPSKVSGADMKNAASTANNFHQRHGAQVASGMKTANGLSQKYGIAGKMNSFASSSQAPSPPPPRQSPGESSQGVAGKKLAPPPPPKRRVAAAGGNGGNESGSPGEPPPIPLSSKPKF
ncbi:hypothetical protein GQ44DRAFT_824535 [Phaeosphaeriaceae sp. PMI808]|nr:hypothetical protein GQ44DRAFT_824535 [Phaeosphaeriaceae sp. PMI808]